MNLAFPALLIVVLILPGVIARFWYRKGNWEYPIHVEPFVEQVFQGLIWAAGLHFVWATGAHVLLKENIDVQSVLVLLTGVTGEAMSSAVQSATAHPVKVLAYFISLYLISAFAGYATHVCVRRYKLDRRYRLLRFENEWHYVLSGEVLQFPVEEGGSPSTEDRADEPVDFVQASAIMEIGGKAYLYTGRLKQFFFDRQGKLDRLVLADTFRRRIDSDRAAGEEQRAPADDARFYKIEGDYFVIRYADVKNLNIGYWKLMKVSAVDMATPPDEDQQRTPNGQKPAQV